MLTAYPLLLYLTWDLAMMQAGLLCYALRVARAGRQSGRVRGLGALQFMRSTRQQPRCMSSLGLAAAVSPACQLVSCLMGFEPSGMTTPVIRMILLARWSILSWSSSDNVAPTIANCNVHSTQITQTTHCHTTRTITICNMGAAAPWTIPFVFRCQALLRYDWLTG